MQRNKQRTEEQKRGSEPRWRKRITIVVLLSLALLLVVNRLLPNAEEDLAAFDAARAVPDEENAALVYAKVLRGDVASLSTLESAVQSLMETASDPVSAREGKMVMKSIDDLELPEGLLHPDDKDLVLSYPWTSAEYPKLRQWLDEHRSHINGLVEAAQKPACWFPLRPEPNDMGLFDVPLGIVRQYSFVLRYAASNDMGEGDTAAALSKDLALASLGEHFQAQPATLALLIGIACEASGLHRLADFVVTGPATDRDLDTLIVKSPDLENRWESIRQRVHDVRNALNRVLKDKRHLSIRAYTFYRKIRYDEDEWTGENRTHELYHRVLCERRAHHILVELRRFKNRTGDWPDRLEEIASQVTPLALIDPHNEGPYIYQREDDGFCLYSMGPSSRDVNGQRLGAGRDIWVIWSSQDTAQKRKDAEDLRKAREEERATGIPRPDPSKESHRLMMEQLAEIYGEDFIKHTEKDANDVQSGG